MLLGVFLLFVFPLARELPFVNSVEYLAPIQFIEEPKNIQFSNRKSGYLHCQAKATSTYSNYKIKITWRYSDGSNVKNIPKTILDFSNGTLGFPPFQKLVPRVHQGKFQCVAKLSLQNHAILSRVAVVDGIILKPYKVTVEDQYVIDTGGTASFTCVYPKDVSSYVKLKRWWINKKIVKPDPSGHLVIRDVQHRPDDLFYCMVQNVLTGEVIASNVAKLFIRRASGLSRIPLRFNIQPQNKTSLEGEAISLDCLTSRRNVEYTWKHDDKIIKLDHRILSVDSRSLRITKTRLADIGMYTCIVRDRNSNESISSSCYVLIRVPLTFRAGPVKIATSHNISVTFQCDVNGYPRPTISWYKDAKEIINNSKTVREGNNLVVKTVWVKDRGIYQCTASNGIEMIHQAASLIVGEQLPKITESFKNQLLDERAKINISCTAIDNQIPTVSWYRDGKLIGEASDSRVKLVTRYEQFGYRWTLQIERATAADSGVYRCQAKNLGGMNFSEAEIIIKGPAKITFVSGNITSLSGKDVNITCRAKGYGTLKITWFDKHNNLLPKDHLQSINYVDDGSILTIKEVKPSDKGYYKCKAISDIEPSDNSRTYLDVFNTPEQKDGFEIKEEGSKVLLMCDDESDNIKEWTKDGKSVEKPPRIFSQGHGLLLRINKITKNDAGNYVCSRATDGAHLKLIEIVVITRPRFTNQHIPIYNVLEHGNIQMFCPASGFPTPRVEWKRKIKESFQPLPDSSRFHTTLNGSLTILNATIEDNTNYACIAYNPSNIKDYRSSKLNVNVPAKIVKWLTMVSGNAGNIIKLDCGATGNQKLIFTWLKDNKEIHYNARVTMNNNPPSLSSLIIKRMIPKDAGNYACKVKNAFGKDEKTLTLIVRDKPLPPVITKKKMSKRSITIFWDVKFDGNSPIISYQIAFKKSWSPWNQADYITVSANQTSYVITQLQPHTSYNIRIKAENRVGLSSASKHIRALTDEDAPSSAPSSIKITPEDKSFRIQWGPPEYSNGVIRGYNISYKKNSSKSVFKNIETDDDKTEAFISDLKVYTRYEIMLQAFTKAGYGPNSEIIIKRTKEGVPSKSPTIIKVGVINSTAISLSWIPPHAYSINGKLVGYMVSYKHRGTEEHISIGNQTSIILQHLRKYTKYSIKIAARTKKGPGKTSAVVKAVTKEDIPGPPKYLKAIVTSVTSIKLEWGEPENPNGNIISYGIYYDENDEQDSYNYTQVIGTQTSYEFEKMTENRTYYFWIRAKTRIGEGNSTVIENASTSKGPPRFIKGQESSVVTAKWKTEVTLVCYKFSGFPTPNVMWLDSREKSLNMDNNGNKFTITPQGRLKIRNLQREDSQRYICRVMNKLGSIKRAVTLKVQESPSPPQNIEFSVINTTALKITWKKGFDGNSIITNYSLKYRRSGADWKILYLSPDLTEFTINNIRSTKLYTFQMSANNEIGLGEFSKPRNITFDGRTIFETNDEIDVDKDVRDPSSRIFYKDSAVLGTLIAVCLFIVIVIIVLVLLTKLGFNPGSKLAQGSVNTWRWLMAKRNSSENRRRHRTSGGSSTDGHLGGSSSSLSQPASNSGSQFSLPRTSSGRATESGYITNVSIPLPFGNHTPGSNVCGSISGSSDEGIGPETRCDKQHETNENHYQSSIPLRSSNGTPAPLTLIMSPRMYYDPESLEKEATSSSKRPQGFNARQNIAQNKERTSKSKMEEEKDEEQVEDVSPDSPVGKTKIFFKLSGAYDQHPAPLNMSPRRPKYEDGHFIIGPDIDNILAYRPPRCYDSTSSEYSSSRDELAQAYEFGKIHHLDDFYGRPTLESVSSSGETASSEKDGICHFTTELSVGRPFLIPVAILPPPPNQRLRTRDRNRNTQAVPLKTYYEKDETLV